MRESKIENDICQEAKNRGWLVYKFKSPTSIGVPDRIFLRKGFMFFIEFKASGKETRKIQNKIIKKIKDQDFDVYIIDSIEDGLKLLDSYD